MEHLHVSGQVKLLMLVMAVLAMHGAAQAATTIVNQSPLPVLLVGLINLQASTLAEDGTSSQAEAEAAAAAAAASRALWKQEAATWGATSVVAVRAAVGKLADEEAASALGALAVGPNTQVDVPPFFSLPGNFSLVNQANGRAAGPVSLLDGSLLVVKRGLVRNTVDVVLGALISGVITLLQTVAKSL